MAARLVGDVIQVTLGVGELVVDGGRDRTGLEGPDGGDDAGQAGRGQRVPDHGLGGADWDSVGVLSEHVLERLRFEDVVLWCGGPMSVDVVDQVRVCAGHLENAAQHRRHRGAVR